MINIWIKSQSMIFNYISNSLLSDLSAGSVLLYRHVGAPQSRVKISVDGDYLVAETDNYVEQTFVAKYKMGNNRMHVFAGSIADYMFGQVIEEGDEFVEHINQADRECVVIKVNRTRLRIEWESSGRTMSKYEIAKHGLPVFQGWRTGTRVGDDLYYRPFEG